MAKGRPSNVKPTASEIKKLWQNVPPREWFGLLCELSPQLKWSMVGQTKIKGCCAWHEEKTPSLFLDFAKGFGKCFGCDKFVSDLVSLIAKVNNCNYTEALILLHTRFGLDKLFSSNPDAFNEMYHVQEAKKAAAIAMNAVINEVLREHPAHLSYCEPAVNYLIDTRKIPMQAMTSLPIGVFAKPEHINKYVPDAKLHSIIEKYFSKYQSVTFWGAIVFHYNDSPGTISRFKFRMFDKKINTFGHDFVYVDDAYANALGVYGLHKYARRIGANETNAYITEGEFDVLSVMAQQDVLDKPDFMIFGTGGTGSTNLGFLGEYGIKTIWMVPDHPAKQGDKYAISILGAKPSVLDKSMTYKVFQWPIELAGMDLDEAVKMNGYLMVNDYMSLNRSTCFMNSTPWIISRCNKEIELLKLEVEASLEETDDDTEKMNLQSELRTKITDTLLRWFNLIHEPADKVTFTNNYTAAEGIDISTLSSVSNAMYSLDTYDGVVKKVMQAFMDHFSLAYYTVNHGEPHYKIWVKQRHITENLKFNENALQQFIAQHVCMSIPDWFDILFPDNPIYYEGIEEKHTLKAGEQKREHALRIFKHAFLNLIHKAVPIADLSVRSQGLHFADLPTEARRKGNMYFINGKKVFKGNFIDTDVLEWAPIENVVDSGLVFDSLNMNEEWSFVEEITDLYSGGTVDLLMTYNNVKEITKAWKFKQDDIIQEYLPAYIMSLPIQRATGIVNMTFITGESQSGKTSLVHGLLGGTRNKAHKVPTLLEPAMFSSNATSAALYQSMDGKSLVFILDEAEKSQAHNTLQDSHTNDVYRLLYAVSQGGSDILRGGTSKEGRVSYHLHMPVLLAAISMPTDTTFLSRVLIIETQKEMGRMPPENYITEKFSDMELAQIRNNVTVGLINKVPTLIRHAQNVLERLMKIGRTKGFVSNRFLNSVLLPLTIYDYIGIGNAETLYARILDAFRDRLMSIHYTDNKSDIINACLYTESIKYLNTTGNNDYVSAKALINNGDYGILNSSDSGIYIMTDEFWLVLVWRQLKYTTLIRSSFAGIAEAAMREQAHRSKWVMQEVDKETHKHIIKTLNLKDVRSPLEYTVLDADYLVEKPTKNIRKETVLPECTVEVSNERIRKRKK